MSTFDDWRRGDLLPTDTKLWLEHPASQLPMTARAYATSIMGDLRKAGMDVPLQTIQGYTTQDTITVIVETAMAKAVETYRETRWWRRLERKITGREWP